MLGGVIRICIIRLCQSANLILHARTYREIQKQTNENRCKALKSKIKVRNTAKIRKRYNQVPHPTQDTTWESNINTINITNKSQEVSPFLTGDHKAAMNRRESMRNTRHKNTNDPQKKYCLGTVSKNI